MEDKRIYSLNRIAYLIANDCQNIIWGIDPDNKCFVIVNDDVSKCLERYKTDVFLHSFIGAYAEVRRKVKELKNNK